VFQRIDTKKLIADAAKAEKKEAKQQQKQQKKQDKAAAAEDGSNLITIADFTKVELRVARVLSAEKVEKADKLLRLMLDDGAGQRQIVAGIAMHYDPAELVDKHVIVVANLKPAKLRGIVSEGMLLAATDSEGQLSILTTERPVGTGARVS
jgi:methionyl-tRNA synthetase